METSNNLRDSVSEISMREMIPWFRSKLTWYNRIAHIRGYPELQIEQLMERFLVKTDISAGFSMVPLLIPDAEYTCSGRGVRGIDLRL